MPTVSPAAAASFSSAAGRRRIPPARERANGERGGSARRASPHRTRPQRPAHGERALVPQQQREREPGAPATSAAWRIHSDGQSAYPIVSSNSFGQAHSVPTQGTRGRERPTARRHAGAPPTARGRGPRAAAGEAAARAPAARRRPTARSGCTPRLRSRTTRTPRARNDADEHRRRDRAAQRFGPIERREPRHERHPAERTSGQTTRQSEGERARGAAASAAGAEPGTDQGRVRRGSAGVRRRRLELP